MRCNFRLAPQLKKRPHNTFCSIASFCHMASPSTPRQRPLTDINDQIRDVTTPLLTCSVALNCNKHCVTILLRALLLMRMTAHARDCPFSGSGIPSNSHVLLGDSQCDNVSTNFSFNVQLVTQCSGRQKKVQTATIGLRHEAHVSASPCIPIL